MNNLDRFVKNKNGVKVEMKVTSINVETRHLKFLKLKNLNLSGMIRELIDSLILGDTKGETNEL